MSNALYPTLAGLTFNVEKEAEFNTIIQRSVSLNELRGTFTAAPIYRFGLQYELLRDDTTYNELKSLFGFYLARQGDFDSFLFLDPDDKTATQQSLGTGTGARTQFQMTRAYGAFTESVCNIGASPQIYLNGVLQASGYTVSSTGLVTFTSAPGNGVEVTWSGTYYYRCRFERGMTFNKFMNLLWEARRVSFLGSLGTKI